MSATQLALAVREGAVSAIDLVSASLDRIESVDPQINSFTLITRERAIAEAQKIDALRAQGATLPPLAGVPYAVKNLFDLKDEVTISGSKVLRNSPAATADAFLVERLRSAGGICVGALNMDEFAYGFTTENSHVGPCHNPHDVSRIAGGSSGGCGASIAAGLVPISLGSDTNGSIRVPSSVCGIFGLKPSFGRLSRTGSYPFVTSLDHLGPFARSVEDLARVYDICQSPDPVDHACAQRPIEPTFVELSKGIDGLRIARLTGYFDELATPLAQQASRLAAAALGAESEVELPHVDIARAAAFAITGSEGGSMHLPTIRHHYADYEPFSRDRFISGALTPAAWYLKAQRFRTWFLQRANELFKEFDVLIAPATPCPAWPIGTEWIELNGKQFPARASMGLFTQPISFIGLPVVAAPIYQEGELPLGVQLIAPPWREDLALRAAAQLEKLGVARSNVAKDFV